MTRGGEPKTTVQSRSVLITAPGEDSVSRASVIATLGSREQTVHPRVAVATVLSTGTVTTESASAIDTITERNAR